MSTDECVSCGCPTRCNEALYEAVVRLAKTRGFFYGFLSMAAAECVALLLLWLILWAAS